jgi:hypothetical protein
MVVGAFYGSLAAAASVFIGILSAFLVNSLVTTRQEQRQLQRRRERIESELEGLRAQREKYQERVDEIKADRRSREANRTNQYVDRFISDRVDADGFATPPECTNSALIVEEFAEFRDYDSVDTLSDVEREVLNNRQNEILVQLASAAASSALPTLQMMQTPHNATIDKALQDFRDRYDIENLMPVTQTALEKEYREWEQAKNMPRSLRESMSSPITDPINLDSLGNINPITTTATPDKRIRESTQHSQNRLQLIEATANIEDRERRKQALEDRLQSLSLTPVRETLRYSGLAILLSVVVPLWTYLCYELDIVLVHGYPAAAPVLVFFFWLAGLLLVLQKLRERINNRD